MRELAAIVCLLASACAFRPQMERVAVDHNALVANTANELLLVNILRARERQPLHFTSIAKLFGDAQVSGTVGASTAIRGGTPTTTTNAASDLVQTATLAGTEVTTPSASLTLGGRTSMDVAVYDTQEFYQGITSSVPPSTLAHFIHQGWSDELITYLFVASVDFIANKNTSQADATIHEGERLESFVNDPDDNDLGNQFRSFVNCYRLWSVPKTVADRTLFPVSALKQPTAQDLLAIDGEKLEVDAYDPSQPGKVRWIRRRGRTADALALRRVSNNFEQGEAGRCDAEVAEERRLAAEGGITGKGRYPRRKATLLGISPALPILHLTTGDDHSTVATGTLRRGDRTLPVDVQVVLRSIDGVIYFLGEYLRGTSPRYKLYRQGGPDIPILAVMSERPANTFVRTSFGGRPHYVPGSPDGRLDDVGGRSTQVFTLVQQLLNLQKTAKERPTTQTVRVVR